MLYQRRCTSHLLAGGNLYAAHASVLNGGTWTFAQRKLRVDFVEVPLDEEGDTDSGRVSLLARFGEKDQIAVERHAGTLHEQEHHQVRGQIVLIVGCSSAPHKTITQHGAE